MEGTAIQPPLDMTIKPDPLYDRTLELAAFDRAWKRHGAGGQMLLLYGRKRLGKTFLLQRFFTAGVVDPEKVDFRHLQAAFGGGVALAGPESSPKRASGRAEKCAKKLRGASGSSSPSRSGWH